MLQKIGRCLGITLGSCILGLLLWDSSIDLESLELGRVAGLGRCINSCYENANTVPNGRLCWFDFEGKEGGKETVSRLK